MIKISKNKISDWLIEKNESKEREKFRKICIHNFQQTGCYVITNETSYENPLTGEIEDDIQGYTHYQKTCKNCGLIIEGL